MATLQNIQDTILLAQGYYIELLDSDTALLQGGNRPKHANKLRCIKRLCKALQWDLDIDVNDDTTTSLYDLLLNAIFLYNGGAVAFDPTVYIPGKTIVNVGVPDPITFNQANLVDNDPPNGQWYLPWTSPYTPVAVSVDGVSFTFQFNQNLANGPKGIYNFSNNDPQTIVVTVL